MAKAKDAEKDYTKYLGKPPTALQEHMADWVIEKTGITFGTKKEEAAFREGIRLGILLRIPHQASPENHAARADRKPEPKPAKATKAAPVEAPKPTGKKGRKAAPVAAAAEPEPETVSAPVGKPARRPAKKAGAATKVAPF